MTDYPHVKCILWSVDSNIYGFVATYYRVIGCMAECLAIHNGRKKERVCVKETNENILKMIGGPMIEINRLDIVLSSRYIDKSALHYNKWLHTSVNRANILSPITTFFPQLSIQKQCGCSLWLKYVGTVFRAALREVNAILQNLMSRDALMAALHFIGQHRILFWL